MVKSRISGNTFQILAIGFCLLLANYMFGQKATASLRPEKIQAGDTCTLTILVSGSTSKPGVVSFASWLPAIPRKNISQLGEWRKSGAQWVQQFRVIVLDSASLTLDPLKVTLNAGKSVETNPLSLLVLAVRGGEISNMAPIRNIQPEPSSILDMWPWALSALILCGIFVWLWRKNAKKPKPLPKPVVQAIPQISPLEKVLNQLQELQEKQLWSKNKLIDHYDTMSLILKTYLEERFTIPALESTTQEIIGMIKKTGGNGLNTKLLQEILQKTDLVKYAQSHPADETHIALIKKSKEFLLGESTKPSESANPAPQTKKPMSNTHEPLL
ncbi:MAG: hypothetical protein H6576_00130 [Lewinellaceae bacterium]|nr:hypothetical protein [Saprospiraceae bacterium]MCB9342084.1 hypothetical protein [Lewinellaceae bacterium]